jgi:hypothetical protein
MTQLLYPLALARAHFSHEAQFFHLFSFLFPHLHVLPHTLLIIYPTTRMQHVFARLFHHISTPYISSSLCTNVACGLISHPTCCSIPSITRTMSSSPFKAIFSCSIPHANHLAFAVAPSTLDHTSFASTHVKINGRQA